MKLISLLFLLCLLACNQSEERVDENLSSTVPPITVTQVEDSLTQKLRAVITAIETKELQQGPYNIKNLRLDSIRHEMISMKDYYLIQKEVLVRDFHLSSDNEKTTNAIAYLDKMASKASAKPLVYKVAFHMNAVLAGNIVYDKGYIKYLKTDMSEINIIFP